MILCYSCFASVNPNEIDAKGLEADAAMTDFALIGDFFRRCPMKIE